MLHTQICHSRFWKRKTTFIVANFSVCNRQTPPSPDQGWSRLREYVVSMRIDPLLNAGGNLQVKKGAPGSKKEGSLVWFWKEVLVAGAPILVISSTAAESQTVKLYAPVFWVLIVKHWNCWIKAPFWSFWCGQHQNLDRKVLIPFFYKNLMRPSLRFCDVFFFLFVARTSRSHKTMDQLEDLISTSLYKC